MMDSKTVKLFFLLSVLVLISCGEDCGSINKASKKEETVTSSELQTGGLYLFKNSDSTYSVGKILVLDDFAVHVRYYSNKFKTKPTKINSKDLEVMIGHAPIAREGFLENGRELLSVETVEESELEGYRYYLDAMNK